MGLCVSVNRNECESSSSPTPTAKIVTINGDLREYNVPISPSEILESESISSSSYFLCNSDSLLYDEFIPKIEPETILEPNQIYFVLPLSKRNYRLTASDMAGLAVKASVAIEKAVGGGNKNRRRRSGRISPVQFNDNGIRNEMDKTTTFKGFSNGIRNEGKVMDKTTTFINGGYSRSGSVRKLRRYTSGRAKLAVRSFRLRLATIYEGTTVV